MLEVRRVAAGGDHGARRHLGVGRGPLRMVSVTHPPIDWLRTEHMDTTTQMVFGRKTLVMIGAMVLLGRASDVALAQTGAPSSSVVGTWVLVSEIVRQDGKASEPLGHDPLGLMMLDRGGRFMLMIARRDLPRFAANKRDAGTSEENKAVLAGSLSFYGTYTVSSGVLALRPEASTFPNWVGADQKRSFTIDGDEMRWTNRTPAISGQVAELVWRRAGTP